MKLNKLKTTVFTLITLTWAFLAIQTHASDKWYLGTAITQGFVDERGIDDDDTGGKVFGGYRFNDYFSIEGSYYDFGETSENDNQLDVDGFSLGVVGSVPIANKFSLFAKVGIHYWDVEINGPISSNFSDDSDTDIFYGVGAQYKLSNNWDLRAEVERYEIDDVDLDVVSLGLSFNF